MCGINRMFSDHYTANPIDRAEFARTRDHMAARGPDGKGEWVSADGRIGFGHRRLSIIDMSNAGVQPMSNAEGTFNGEIYNYLDLRRDLEGKGYVFRSSSDTEVLLHLYADKGEEMVHDLRGTFAFTIWDTPRDIVAEGLAGLDPIGLVEQALSPAPREGFNRVETMEDSLCRRNRLLHDTDWDSMANSLEVLVPLVDAELLKRVAGLGPPDANATAKVELAAAPTLSEAVTKKKKTRFAVPVAEWLSGAQAKKTVSAYGYTGDWARQASAEQAKLTEPLAMAA